MSSPISFGQVAQLVKKFEQVGWDAKRISQFGQANDKQFRAIESVLDDPEILTDKDTSHLRFLETVNLAPTSGSHTIEEAGEIFTGGVDPNFRLWGTNTSDNFTLETKIDVYEMKKGGSFQTIISSLRVDLRSLCLTQGQIVEFARTHRHQLRQHGYGTFFLLEANNELFVARVSVLGDLFYVDVLLYRFGDGRVWDADYQLRLVVPQQTL